MTEKSGIYYLLGLVIVLAFGAWLLSEKREKEMHHTPGQQNVVVYDQYKYPTYWSDYDASYYNHYGWRAVHPRSYWYPRYY
jgi:hypothetical protein